MGPNNHGSNRGCHLFFISVVLQAKKTNAALDSEGICIGRTKEIIGVLLLSLLTFVLSVDKREITK